MRRLFFYMTVVLLVASSLSEARSPIPEWSEAEWAALQSGDLVPGYILLYMRTEQGNAEYEDLLKIDIELPEPIPSLVPPVIFDPSEVTEADLDRYFSENHESYLVDVQELLSAQQFRDRQAFLDYHAEDSKIPIYIFLFRGEQEVPQEFSAQLQLQKQFAKLEKAVLVYYHLGQPEKTRMAMTPDLRKQVPHGDYRRALASAIAEATEKSEEVDQLENFAVQLSIRLYWIERNLEGESTEASVTNVVEDHVEILGEENSPQSKETIWQSVKAPVLLMGGLLLVSGVGFWGRYLAMKKREYLFAPVNSPERLGAPHSAGVGAVITFRSRHLPPSAQKSEMADYL